MPWLTGIALLYSARTARRWVPAQRTQRRASVAASSVRERTPSLR